MIIEVEKIQPNFQPIKIIISVENLEDLETIDSLFAIVVGETGDAQIKEMAYDIRKQIRKGAALLGV